MGKKIIDVSHIDLSQGIIEQGFYDLQRFNFIDFVGLHSQAIPGFFTSNLSAPMDIEHPDLSFQEVQNFLTNEYIKNHEFKIQIEPGTLHTELGGIFTKKIVDLLECESRILARRSIAQVFVSNSHSYIVRSGWHCASTLNVVTALHGTTNFHYQNFNESTDFEIDTSHDYGISGSLFYIAKDRNNIQGKKHITVSLKPGDIIIVPPMAWHAVTCQGFSALMAYRFNEPEVIKREMEKFGSKIFQEFCSRFEINSKTTNYYNDDTIEKRKKPK